MKRNYQSENPNTNLILTDDVGKSLYEQIKEKDNFKIRFIDDYQEAQDFAIKNNKNILFIYRSNYSQVSKR